VFYLTLEQLVEIPFIEGTKLKSTTGLSSFRERTVEIPFIEGTKLKLYANSISSLAFRGSSSVEIPFIEGTKLKFSPKL